MGPVVGNQATGSKKVLPPLLVGGNNNTLLPMFLQDRPSTVPLMIEAIYGERGSGDDKMYLVKFVSVESEQWTNASFIDPGCDALQLWRKAKAVSRYRKPQPQVN
jgi:hypothetical protein